MCREREREHADCVKTTMCNVTKKELQRPSVMIIELLGWADFFLSSLHVGVCYGCGRTDKSGLSDFPASIVCVRSRGRDGQKT
jgi:hypothetical protein